MAASLGTLGVRLARQDRHPVRTAHALLLNDNIPTYDVRFESRNQGDGRPASGGGGGGEGGQTSQAGLSAQITNMEAPTSLPTRELTETDPLSTLEPSAVAVPIASLTPSGNGKPGTGGGSGTGVGGTGFRRGSKLGLLSADPSKNPILELEDMNVVHQELPEYPLLAVLSSICGDVTVEVLVSEKGIPLTSEVTSSPHRSLTKAVLAATPKWRFMPVLVGGIPVRVQLKILITFTILQRNGQPKPHWPSLPVKRPAESLHIFQESDRNMAWIPGPEQAWISPS